MNLHLVSGCNQQSFEILPFYILENLAHLIFEAIGRLDVGVLVYSYTPQYTG